MILFLFELQRTNRNMNMRRRLCASEYCLTVFCAPFARSISSDAIRHQILPLFVNRVDPQNPAIHDRSEKGVLMVFNFSTGHKLVLVILATVIFGHVQAKADLFISDGDNVDDFDGTSLNKTFISINTASGLAVDTNGTLYAASLNDAQVYSYNATTGA